MKGYGRVQSDVTSPERAGYFSEWEKTRERQSSPPGATSQPEVASPQSRLKPANPPQGAGRVEVPSPGTEAKEIRQRMQEVERLRRALEEEYASLERRLRAAVARQAPPQHERDAMLAAAVQAKASREEQQAAAGAARPDPPGPSPRVKTAMADLGSRLAERFGSIRAAFLHLDTDRSSCLDAAEFRNILELYSFEPSLAEEMVAALDGNGDGLIEFYEFVQLLEGSVGGVKHR